MKISSQFLAQLVAETCQYPPGSKERQKNLTKIIRLVSTKLWKENTPYYEDALQETWVYFCRNICEGQAGKAYDSKKATVATWLNNYLKWRLKDGYIQTQKQRKQTVSKLVDEDNRVSDPIDSLPARPDVPPLLKEVTQWAKTDVQKKLSRICLENHPQVTAQTLILKRLPPEVSWQQLAAEYGVAAGTLSSFYQRKCKPLLREFSKSQGYM